MTPHYTAIIFDLGDVLFTWSAETTTSVSSKMLHSILSSPTWFEYERGRISEDECYACVGLEHSLESEEIREVFQQARDSLKADDRLIRLIHDLRTQHGDGLRVYAMSNISLPDYTVLRNKPADWSIFDHIFPSGEVGERKPNLGFYRHVLAATNVDPLRTIFVDDKLENVLSAQSLGLHGIVYDNFETVERSLRNLLGNPITRGQDYLRRHAGCHDSITEATNKYASITLKENFSQLLILEATNDESLVNLVEHPRAWNFFQGKAQLTTDEFPFDVDTTSLALTIFKRDKRMISSVMDEMLDYVDEDGIIQTYFDHKRPRFDPVVCVNALTLFYVNGRHSDLRRTYDWVHEVLRNRAYLAGTRYYETPECFLYFVSRLLIRTGDQDLHATLKPLLRERIQERIGVEGDSVALSMRVLACEVVGVRNEVDLRALLSLQCVDGGWGIGWIFKYGSSGIRIGNRGLSTALAVKAIEAMAAPAISFADPPPPHRGGSSPPAIPAKLATRKRRYSNALRNSLTRFWHSGRKSVEI